jgi:hypothetical protein
VIELPAKREVATVLKFLQRLSPTSKDDVSSLERVLALVRLNPFRCQEFTGD